MKKFLIVGAGIIGLSLAKELSNIVNPENIIVIEKEKDVGLVTSARNSGVIHTNFHLKPRSLKAKLVSRGSMLMRKFCEENRIPCLKLGKFVVALNDEERRILRIYEKWAKINQDEVEVLGYGEFKKFEPNARCIEAIYAKNVAVTNPRAVTLKLSKMLEANGVKIIRNCQLFAVKLKQKIISITNKGDIECDFLINAAGLYADDVAKMFGLACDYIIVPFRGDYLKLKKEYSNLINSLIYRVPDPSFPFLGVHFTKRIDGSVILGPTATLAIGKENYGFLDLDFLTFSKIAFSKNFFNMLKNPNFIKLALAELRRSFSLSFFFRDLKEIVPSLKNEMVQRSFSGIRAQLVDSRGNLVEDFLIEYDERSLHILNAVSPAFTSSFSFAEYLVNLMKDKGLIFS